MSRPHVAPAWAAVAARSVCALLFGGAVVLAGCARSHPEQLVVDGNGERGRVLLASYGCGTCHEIPGVRNATGTVGPPLAALHERVYLAGVLPNTPENLVRWIRAPQEVDPQTAMPNLGVGESQARDMATFLYANR